MSLLSKEDYATMTELPYNETFQTLFQDNKDITHADGKNLVLPATTLRKNCYYQMFINCHSLTSLDLSTFNTEHVMNLDALFFQCYSLQIVDITSFNIDNVYSMASMFSHCSKLTTICCYGDWSTSTANSDYMFQDCTALIGGLVTLTLTVLSTM